MLTKHANLQDAIEILMFEDTLKIFILLLLRYDIIENNEMNTIGCVIFSNTNSINKKHQIHVNMRFMKSFGSKQIIYFFVHEILHIILLHNNRLEGYSTIIANMAQDHVINEAIQNDINKKKLKQIEEPPSNWKPFFIEELIGTNMSCEQVAEYIDNKIKLESVTIQSNNEEVIDIDSINNDFEKVSETNKDEKSNNEKVSETNKDEKSNNEKVSETNKDEKSNNEEVIDIDSINNDFEGSIKIKYKDENNNNKECALNIYNNKINSDANLASLELSENFKLFKTQFEKENKQNGFCSGSCFDLVKTETKVILTFIDKFKKSLNDSLHPDLSKQTWQRINKRKKYGTFYAPGPARKEEYDNLLLAVDTSGSMNKHDFALVKGVIRELFEYFNTITIIHHDTKITNILKPLHADDIELDKFKGRGGTSHTKLYNYIEKHKENISTVVLITDYYSNLDRIHNIEMYDWINNMVTILIISEYGKKEIKANFSEIIHAEEIIE